VAIDFTSGDLNSSLQWTGSSWRRVEELVIPSGVDCLVVAIAARQDYSISTAEWNGTSVPERLNNDNFDDARVIFLTLSEPDIGTYDLVINQGSSAAQSIWKVYGLSGTDISTASAHVEATDSDYGWASSGSVTLDPTVLDESMCFHIATLNGNQTFSTEGADQTVDSQDILITSNTHAAWSHGLAQGVTQDMSWTHSAANRFCQGGIAIKAGAGGGSIPRFKHDKFNHMLVR